MFSQKTISDARELLWNICHCLPSSSCSSKKFMHAQYFAFAGVSQKLENRRQSLKPHIPFGSFAVKGNTWDKNNGPSCFTHYSVQTDLINLWILPAVALALIKPNILTCGGIFNDSSALQASSQFRYTPAPWKLTRSFSALYFYPAMSFEKWKVKSFLQNLIYQQFYSKSSP